MACIDRNAEGITLVVDDEQHLIGTVTDGDIRRAILAGVDLNLPVQDLLDRRVLPPHTPHQNPLTVLVGTPESELIELMTRYTLRHIPLVDHDGRLVGLVLLSDLIREYELPLRAVVMAGGYGTRLRPLTEDLPKPMLRVGDKPLLELIIEQLRRAGIRKVNIATHYKGDVITKHFGNGQEFGVEISYVEENQPLGTAGALSLLEGYNEPFIVINGDILTRVNFRAMLDFHRDHQADMTVAVRPYELQVPYGVIETEGANITGISEKPIVQHFINSGIYLLNSDIRGRIPNGQSSDMPDLINRLIREGRRVVSFPVREYWLDIGQARDYQQAQKDVKEGKI